MVEQVIVGFLVVRVPEMNKDQQGRGAYTKVPPQIGNLFYAGIERMAWFDLDELRFNGILPDDILKERKKIAKENSDYTGIDVCQDSSVALKLLRVSNKEEENNEIIAIFSEKLLEFKGSLVVDSSSLEWIGYDIVSLGWWSLISDGIFVRPSQFESWRGSLNSSGLIDSIDPVDEYIQLYNSGVAGDVLEKIPDTTLGVDIIRVGRFQI